MKKILAAVLMTVGLVLSAHAQNPSTVAFNWGYTFTSAYPVCTSTVTTNCIQSFQLSEGSTVLATVPATSSTSYTYTLATLPTAGTHTYSLVATGVYQGGSINSLPAMVSLQVPGTPSTPSSFTVVLR